MCHLQQHFVFEQLCRLEKFPERGILQFMNLELGKPNVLSNSFHCEAVQRFTHIYISYFLDARHQRTPYSLDTPTLWTGLCGFWRVISIRFLQLGHSHTKSLYAVDETLLDSRIDLTRENRDGSSRQIIYLFNAKHGKLF